MPAGKSSATRKAVAKRQRDIQAEVAAADRNKSKEKDNGAMQAGARRYPEPPFPKQHQPKPGSAREGADIAISYLDEDADAEVTRKAVEAEGRRCILLPGNVADRNYCRKAVTQTVKQLGRLDVLVNNAAFQVHTQKFEDLSAEHFDLTLKTNLYGYFHMAQAAVEHMASGSAIINTGSVTGIDGSKSLVDYSMTKGGIHAFTRALAGNRMPRGIRVNAVAPGPVWTPLNPSDKEPDDVSTFGAKVPMKRPAQPEEIAPAYVFLASPHCSSYITGEILPIIGGY